MTRPNYYQKIHRKKLLECTLDCARILLVDGTHQVDFQLHVNEFILIRARLSLLVKVSKVYIFIICSRVTQVNI